MDFHAIYKLNICFIFFIFNCSTKKKDSISAFFCVKLKKNLKLCMTEAFDFEFLREEGNVYESR